MLADDFWHLLQSCNSHFTAEDPLIIILDSLDQLSPEDGAFQLTWLPMRLPPWVKIIISTISNDKYNCLELVKGLIPGQFFVEIPRLPLDDAVRIVNSWLSSNKRNLTTEQRTVLLSVFQKCSLPIFLKVSFEEALRWKSYTPTDEIRLESTVRGKHVFKVSLLMIFWHNPCTYLCTEWCRGAVVPWCRGAVVPWCHG